MYLTQDEFTILKGLLAGKRYAEISDNLEKRLCSCDPRIDSLYIKYGVNDRVELAKRVNFDKIEICTNDDIPYWKYDENNQLISKIPIAKEDVEKLMKLFEQEKEDNCYLVYSPNTLYEYLALETPNRKEYIYERLG